MAISEAYANTQDVSGTEHSCPNDATYNSANGISTDGVYQVFLDVSDMGLGDILRIRVYEKVQSTDTQRVVYEHVLSHSQSTPIWVSPSLVLIHAWDVTLYGVSGTITVTWSIRKVA